MTKKTAMPEGMLDDLLTELKQAINGLDFLNDTASNQLEMPAGYVELARLVQGKLERAYDGFLQVAERLDAAKAD